MKPECVVKRTKNGQEIVCGIRFMTRQQILDDTPDHIIEGAKEYSKRRVEDEILKTAIEIIRKRNKLNMEEKENIVFNEFMNEGEILLLCHPNDFSELIVDHYENIIS